MKDHDWEQIIQRHLDGLTTNEEAAALSENIVADKTVRSMYLQAAQIHGALADEVLALDLDPVPSQLPGTTSQPRSRSLTWPKQLTAGLVMGALIGVLGVGVAWAVGTPRTQARALSIANGTFENTVGPVERGFPSVVGQWSGEPSEVIEEADGNRTLRFLETANVTGTPNGGASACNVFQIIDLSSLQAQYDANARETQQTLALSARFRREAAANDAELPRVTAGLTIQLYQAEPESIGKAWPLVIRDAVSLGKKAIKITPGQEAETVSASCILAPEATIALISLNVHSRIATKTPIPLGGFFADDVQLTVIEQPNLPVRFVK